MAFNDYGIVSTSFRRWREDYLKGLDFVEGMLSGYEIILENAGLSERTDVVLPDVLESSRQNLQIELATLSIATQADSLLKLLSDLRIQLSHSNPKEKVLDTHQNVERCLELQNESHNHIQGLRNLIESSTLLLESVLDDAGADEHSENKN